MKVAFVFPGQRAEAAQAGPTWIEASAETRRLLEEAARHAGLPMARLFSEAGRALEHTDVQQPVLTALSLGVAAELAARGVRPDIAAGHSLGELAACAVAGGLDAEEAVALAAVRGRAMARGAARRPGGMLALTTADRSAVNEALRVAQANGIAALAAQNAPDQWVISGEWSALRAVAARFPVTPVPVTGPWHTAAMAGAVEEFREAARAVIRGPLRLPLVCNRTGARTTDAAALADLLAGQLTHPVEWLASLRTLAEEGVDHAVVVGPAKAMRNLVRRGLDPAIAVHGAERPEDLDGIAEVLAR